MQMMRQVRVLNAEIARPKGSFDLDTVHCLAALALQKERAGSLNSKLLQAGKRCAKRAILRQQGRL
jgi:hypothetical protein